MLRRLETHLTLQLHQLARKTRWSAQVSSCPCYLMPHLNICSAFQPRQHMLHERIHPSSPCNSRTASSSERVCLFHTHMSIEHRFPDTHFIRLQPCSSISHPPSRFLTRFVLKHDAHNGQYRPYGIPPNSSPGKLLLSFPYTGTRLNGRINDR